MRTISTDIHLANTIYLKDSYLLNFSDSPDSLVFFVEFALRESHPEYTSPKEGEARCYRHGKMIFKAPSQVLWTRREFSPISGADRDTDYGSLYVFDTDGTESYRLAGEWGEVSIHCISLQIILDSALAMAPEIDHVPS